MVSHQTSSTGTAQSGTSAGMRMQRDDADMVESTVRKIDEPVRRKMGMSIFHMLSLASIGASVSLFLAGRKDLAIFIGLWPPTFEALRAASENRRMTAIDTR